MSLKRALHHNVEGDGLAGHSILLFGHHVENRGAWSGSYGNLGRGLGGRIGDHRGFGDGFNYLNLSAGRGVLDGRLNGHIVAVNGRAGEGNDYGGEIVDAYGSVILRPESGCEKFSILGKRIGGHHDAEAYAALDGCAVENDHCFKSGRRIDDCAVSGGNELEVFAVVIELEVEEVRLEIAFNMNLNVEGVARFYLLIIGKNAEIRMAVFGAFVFGEFNVVDRGKVAGRVNAGVLLIIELDLVFAWFKLNSEGLPIGMVLAVVGDLAAVYIDAQTVPINGVVAFAHADELEGDLAAVRARIHRGGEEGVAVINALVGAANVGSAVPFNNNFPRIIGNSVVEYKGAALSVYRFDEINGGSLGGLFGGSFGGIVRFKNDRAVLAGVGQRGRGAANGHVAKLNNYHAERDGTCRILADGEVDRHKNAAATEADGGVHRTELSLVGLAGEIGHDEAAVGAHAAARSYRIHGQGVRVELQVRIQYMHFIASAVDHNGYVHRITGGGLYGRDRENNLALCGYGNGDERKRHHYRKQCCKKSFHVFLLPKTFKSKALRKESSSFGIYPVFQEKRGTNAE